LEFFVRQAWLRKSTVTTYFFSVPKAIFVARKWHKAFESICSFYHANRAQPNFSTNPDPHTPRARHLEALRSSSLPPDPHPARSPLHSQLRPRMTALPPTIPPRFPSPHFLRAKFLPYLRTVRPIQLPSLSADVASRRRNLRPG